MHDMGPHAPDNRGKPEISGAQPEEGGATSHGQASEGNVVTAVESTPRKGVRAWFDRRKRQTTQAITDLPSNAGATKRGALARGFAYGGGFTTCSLIGWWIENGCPMPPVHF